MRKYFNYETEINYEKRTSLCSYNLCCAIFYCNNSYVHLRCTFNKRDACISNSLGDYIMITYLQFIQDLQEIKKKLNFKNTDILDEAIAKYQAIVDENEQQENA